MSALVIPPSRPKRGGPNLVATALVTCPVKVTVKITLAHPVACPGHPLEMTAVGSPAGGAYRWGVSGGGAALVNGAGNPTTTDKTLYLRSFQPDNRNGRIPTKQATVRVTYKYRGKTASASQRVPIHKIDFEVTDTGITAGVTQVNEGGRTVTLGQAPGVDTMNTTPKVKILLDASCPRKDACAANHRAAWLQTVLTADRRARYTHTLIEWTMPLPIRDGDEGKVPFYEFAAVSLRPFTGDNDTQPVFHWDSPALRAPWKDPRQNAPTRPPRTWKRLREMWFSVGFRAWLVVQNVEWSAHHPDDSLVYLRYFDWSVKLNVRVDTHQPSGRRCTPASSRPTIGKLHTGKGSLAPVLIDPTGGRATVIRESQQPEYSPPRLLVRLWRGIFG